jgi:hypothetical protein
MSALAELATIVSSLVGTVSAILVYVLAKRTAEITKFESKKTLNPTPSVSASVKRNGNYLAEIDEIYEILLSLMEQRNNYNQRTIFLQMGTALLPPIVSFAIIAIIQSYTDGPLLILFIGPVLTFAAALYFEWVSVPDSRDERFRTLVRDDVERLKALAGNRSIDLNAATILRRKLSSQFPILYCAYGLAVLDDILLSEFYYRASENRNPIE